MDEAQKISVQINSDLQNFPPEVCWQRLIKKIIPAKYPFAVHQLLYKTIYSNWDKIPAPVWFPDENFIKKTHIATLMNEKGFQYYEEFHRWSVSSYTDFWKMMVNLLHIVFDKPYTALIDLSNGIERPKWLTHAKLNIVESCFQAKKTSIAIISQTEQGEITEIRYDELDKLVNRIANSLSHRLKKGDNVGIIMPMTRDAVAIYLGIIKSGYTVAAIPDSFSVDEIAKRLRIANVKLVFCQDQIIRDGKNLPLYDRVVKANASHIVVIPTEDQLSISLREQDQSWQQFLSDNTEFVAVSCDPQDYINILFSSGTTGDPKAIPWDHTSAIKCASDAYLHHDVQPGDVFCWPTNLGWMMGPWLIFACLLNKATIALYEGTPNNMNFGKFVQNAKVTHLGVVPTIVKTWRNTGNMENLDLSAIKLFSSSGERSSIDDMLYLMYLVNYRPAIEYCGGTEIAGAYITGTLIQPCAPAAFTTPTLGLDFVILNERGELTDNGEVALVPPSMGLSIELLNKDHYQVYYEDMPKLADGRQLRRHGDQIERYANGFYRLLGRVDDTMKLAGIKISSAEIEAILNTHSSIYETAAIAVNPPNEAGSQLIIYAVMKTSQKQDLAQLKKDMQTMIKQHLNPLLKIHDVIIVTQLPRTASNKVMRRVLRDEYEKTKFHL